MAWIAAVLAAAAAATGAIGEIQAGRAGKASKEFEAKILEQQADREKQIASGRERDFRKQQSALLASRRASAGATGVDPLGGSMLRGYQNFTEEAELNALRIRAGGETASQRLRQQAILSRAEGTGLAESGYLRGTATMLGGGSKAMGMYAGGGGGSSGGGSSSGAAAS